MYLDEFSVNSDIFITNNTRSTTIKRLESNRSQKNYFTGNVLTTENAIGTAFTPSFFIKYCVRPVYYLGN